MDIFLQVLGMLCLAVIALVVLAFVALRIFAWRLRKRLGAYSDIMASVPTRLHLAAAPEPEWYHADDVAAASGALASLGFRDAGCFVPDEMPSLTLRGFHRPDDSAYAAIYDMHGVGTWVDMVIRYQDGSSLTVTNAPEGEDIDSPPEAEKVWLRGATTEAVEAKLRELAEDTPRTPVSSDAFVTDFERAYAQEMDWRNLRGGTTEEEVRRTALASGERLSEATLDEMVDTYSQAAVDGLSEAALETFLRDATFTGAEWERIDGRFTVIHDRMPMEQVRQAAEAWLPVFRWEDDEIPWPELPDDLQGHPRAAFAFYVQHFEDAADLEHLGEVSAPLPADIYVEPEWEGIGR
ncbi:MAG: hypothetical protein GF320_21730 [Armatimonadia bacterium]|nr:hypothetical protein [Armatimonadia bacterium]